MENKQYVVITTVTMHKHKYVIPVDDLQKENPDVPVNPIEWANDCVTCEDVSELSQDYLGENIIDTEIVDGEEKILEIFDRENEYLKDWSREQKLEMLHNWKFEDKWAKLENPGEIPRVYFEENPGRET